VSFNEISSAWTEQTENLKRRVEKRTAHELMENSTLPYKPQILRNGLTFVLVPVFGATFILLLVYFLWVAAEKSSVEEQHQSDVVIHLNSVFNYWSAADNSLLGLMAERQPLFQFLADRNTELLQGTLNQLKTLRANNPEKLAELQKLSDLIERDITLMARIPRAATPDVPTMAILQQMPKTLLQSYKIRGEVRGLLETQWEALKHERERAQKSREKLHSAILLAAILDIAGGIALALLFAKSMAVRIHKLVQNAKLLKRGKTLSPPLSGDDELAYLDKVLHDTHRRLEQASEHRQWVLSMVAHDMRSPLMSARANLQIMEEQEDDYPEEAIGELQGTYKLLNGVLKHVDGLLSVKERAIDIFPRLNATEVGAVSERHGKIFLQPGILRQSLALMLIPLALQVIPALIIDLRLNDTQNAILEQQRCGEIVLYSDMILMDMVRGSMVQAAYLMTRKQELAERAKESFAQTMSDHKELVQACGENVEWQRYARISEAQDQSKISRILNAKSDDLANSARLFIDVGEIKQVSPESKKERALEKHLAETNLDRLVELNVYQDKLAKKINRVLGLSILINLLFALSLAIIFARTTNLRFKSVMANALKLGRHQTLERPITGKDELARLDDTIYDANTRLEEAATKRLALMSALARELKEPLEQALERLSKFRKIAGSSLCQKSIQYLRMAEASIDRVFELVSDLLTIEQIEAGTLILTPTLCSTDTLAQEAIDTLSGLAKEKNITLENRCSSFDLNVDRGRIIRVLVNYLANAIKFSPAQSSITVIAERTRDPQHTEQTLRFSVQDHGEGMDAQASARVFERYFQATTDQKSLGFGLGLAICKLIVELHGGRLGVESEPGKGSLFWFEIPERVQNVT
jgi:signal transduction histidine kinase